MDSRTPRRRSRRRSQSRSSRPGTFGRVSEDEVYTMGAVLGRVIDDYESLIEVCRQRAVELALSRECIDGLSGCAPGLAGKILGHRQAKKLGPTTLKPILQALGLKLLVIEDDRETALTLAVRE